MKKKKNNKNNDINNLIFNIYTNILNTENNIKNINNVTITDLTFISNFLNYDFIYNNFNFYEKASYNNILKFNNNINKNNLIFNFNLKKNINKQFNHFINKYENFTNKYSKDINYNLNKHGILYIDDFIMLIKDAECIPFWNNNCKKLSDDIFMPIASNLTIDNTPSTFNYNNWFNTEHNIYTGNMDNKKLEIDKQRNFIKQYKNKKTGKMENIIKSHKIKLYFNNNQNKNIKRLLGVYRYFYNRTINYINNYDKISKKTFYFIDCKNLKTKIELDLSKEKMIFTFISIRGLIKENYPKWMNEINFPSHLIDMAIKEAVSAYNACINKFNKYKIPFELKIKTKKNKIQTMNIENTMISEKTNSLFYNLKDQQLNKYIFRNLKTSCKFDKYSNICDSSITFNKMINEFYINLNFEDLKIPNKEILKNKKICAIDPGVKTFITIYSDDSINKIGIGVRDKIEKVCHDIDIVISKQYKKKNGKYKYNHQKRRSLRKVRHRKIKYLENLKEELHNKSIKYLCNKFGKIIIPPFETQKMVMNNKLNSKTARNLINISYYKFLSKLKTRCIEYDIELVIRPEYYTSKTCTKCGNIKYDLKNADIYNCKECGLKIDRDTNGARNILLRNLIT